MTYAISVLFFVYCLSILDNFYVKNKQNDDVCINVHNVDIIVLSAHIILDCVVVHGANVLRVVDPQGGTTQISIILWGLRLSFMSNKTPEDTER